MAIELEYAELHTPLFLSGTNLAMKLDPHKRTGLKLSYDREEKELLVEWMGKTAIIPSGNVAAMVPGKVASKTPAPQPVIKRTLSAQVSSPTSHVFEQGGVKL